MVAGGDSGLKNELDYFVCLLDERDNSMNCAAGTLPIWIAFIFPQYLQVQFSYMFCSNVTFSVRPSLVTLVKTVPLLQPPALPILSISSTFSLLLLFIFCFSPTTVEDRSGGGQNWCYALSLRKRAYFKL